MSLRQLVRIVWRCLELFWELGPVLLTWPLLRTPLRAHWLWLLVRTLERCGPAGIKWGQWASTRYDLFEDDICDTLAALTNSAPAHSYAHTERLVERELGQPLSELFSEFSAVPLASGSIGQVHLATLKADRDSFPAGLPVAVKVQHPNLAANLALDMAILRGAAELVGSFHKSGVSVSDTVRQFATNFYMQLDFRDEAENLRRFNTAFGSSFWAAVVSFPRPLDGMVSEHVLVETFEAGESVADYLGRRAAPEPEAGEARPSGATSGAKLKRQLSGGQLSGAGGAAGGSGAARGVGAAVAGVDPNRRADDEESEDLPKSIALCGVQSYLKMLIFDNFIHADLHPGNVLVRVEEVGYLARLQRYVLLGQGSARVPHIVFLDAGLAAQFDPSLYSNVQEFFGSIIQHDGPAFGRAVLGLSPSQPYVADQDAFVSEVAVKMAEMKAEMDRGEGRAGDNIRSYMESVRAHHVTLDPTVMVALMSMMVLEGWQFRLDPNVSIVGSIETQLNRRSSIMGWFM